MGEAGSVGWQFKRTAYFSIPLTGQDFDKVFEVAVDGGADDVTSDEEMIEIFADVANFKTLSDHLRAAKLPIEDAEVRMLPTQEVELPLDQTLSVMKTIEALEELDDVSNVFTTLKISEDALAAMEQS
jgi:transcriptional/translational regulatory protein YebC/TACO1